MSESVARLLLDTYQLRRAGPAAIAWRRRDRLAELVAFARTSSPYYRQLYRGLPQRVEDPTLLPVTSKTDLMAHFDGAVTNPEVTLDKVRAFVDDPARAGERFLGAYLVATTSGSTGTRGLFIMDDRNAAAASVFSAAMLMAFLSPREVVRIAARGGHTTLIGAMGGHFVGFASIINLLAGEQAAGRLRIRPVFVHPSSEGLADWEYDRIAQVFRAKVRTAYVATECMPGLAEGCERHWLHLTSDWCILEPVDSDYRPVPAGVQSHTVLLSNLANRVQPILQYDLGDSVMQRPDPCPCGNPTPAIRVQGRVADVLSFPIDGGNTVEVAPLVFGTLVDRISGIEQRQIVQTAPDALRVRLRPAIGAPADRVWQEAEGGIRRLLDQRGLAHVGVERAVEPPERSAGGKFREVIPLH